MSKMWIILASYKLHFQPELPYAFSVPKKTAEAIYISTGLIFICRIPKEIREEVYGY